uniref:Uncharacterized protein n=1 Tax=Marseillevirus LCMAC103 TaxID=2506604 RepID=A0A481YUR5_9VIRU|nr:MAG: hypothetical protein LCMAC103_01770 [Marseillevirus LCMAC103]
MVENGLRNNNKLFQDSLYHSARSFVGQRLPTKSLLAPEQVHAPGSMMYNTDNTNIYWTDALSWRKIFGVGPNGEVCLVDADGDTSVCVDDGKDNDTIVLTTPAAGGYAATIGTAGMDVDTTGQVNLDSSQAAATAIVLNASNAAGGIDVDAGTGGVDVDTTGQVNLTSSQAAANAIVLNASNAAGGMDVDTGTGGYTLDTTGGFSIDSSSTTVGSNISTVGAPGVDLLVDSQLGSLRLRGGENASDAIEIVAIFGGINISSSSTPGNDIDITSVGSSINIISAENTSDSLVISALLGGVDILANGTAGEDIDIVATGSSVNISSTENASDAVVIRATLGGIDILASGASAGEDIDITATGSSVNVTSTESATDAIVLNATLGGIDILASGAAAGEDIDITATGSSVNVTSTESATDAIVLNATLGGIDILASGASAGEDIDITATGSSVNVTSTENTAAAIYLHADGGTAETIRIHSDQGTSATSIDIESDVGGISIGAGTRVDIDTATGDILLTAALGRIELTASDAFSDAIRLNAAVGGIEVLATKGLDLFGASAALNSVRINASNAAGGIDIDAGTGGITIDSTGSIRVISTENTSDAVVIRATLGGIDILATGASAGEDIDITATGSSVNITATENTAAAIYLHANGGTSETIRIHSDQGTSKNSIDIESDLGGITLTPASSSCVVLAGTAQVDGPFYRSPTRYYLEEFFKQTPGMNADLQNSLESVRVPRNRDFEIVPGSGSSTDDVTFSATKAGIQLQSDGELVATVVIGPHLDASQTAWTNVLWGTENQTEWECAVVTDTTITTDTILWAGLKLTSVHGIATDADQVYFRFSDPDVNTNWRAITSIANVDTNTDTSVAVVADTVYRFRIAIDSSRLARFYINENLVHTTTALTDDVDFIPYVGVIGSEGNATALVLCYEKISRVLFE